MASGTLPLNPTLHNAGQHNSIFRGAYLGSSVSSFHQTEIKNGTFKGLYIGDYWTINSRNWRIAAFDYFYNKGDTRCTSHHILVVPDSSLGSAQHQTTDTTEGGYVNSLIWENGFSTATSTYNAIFNTDFGAAHRLAHRELLSNAVSSSKSSGWAWTDVPCGNLMNENMVYGSIVWSSQYDCGDRNTQLPLFALAPQYLCNLRTSWWLSSVYSAAGFCSVSGGGHASYGGASNSSAVRPYFVYTTT